MAPGRRVRIEIDRAEGADTDRDQRAVLFEEGRDLVERLLRPGRRELLERIEVIGAGADRAHAPGSTGLNTAVEARRQGA